MIENKLIIDDIYRAVINRNDSSLKDKPFFDCSNYQFHARSKDGQCD
jgi:hypothetical protein